MQDNIYSGILMREKLNHLSKIKFVVNCSRVTAYQYSKSKLEYRVRSQYESRHIETFLEGWIMQDNIYSGILMGGKLNPLSNN
jgi:hypothetical protein